MQSVGVESCKHILSKLTNGCQAFPLLRNSVMVRYIQTCYAEIVNGNHHQDRGIASITPVGSAKNFAPKINFCLLAH